MADGAADAATPSRWPTLGARAGHLARELIIVIVLGLVVSTLLRAFVFQMFEIPSESMENTLQVGDRVAVQKITGFQRGDVIVFEDPSNWLPYPDDGPRGGLNEALEFVGILPISSTHYLIKRVIGTPGDVVVCCDDQGRISVNGRPLDEQAYLYSLDGQTVSPSDYRFTVTVPAGRVFVMGDHRNASADSRCHLTDTDPDGGPAGSPAFVPTERIVGVAVAVVSPLDRLRLLERDPLFDQVPAPSAPAPPQPSITLDGPSC